MRVVLVALRGVLGMGMAWPVCHAAAGFANDPPVPPFAWLPRALRDWLAAALALGLTGAVMRQMWSWLR